MKQAFAVIGLIVAVHVAQSADQDVVVYSATPGGIAAAVSAAKGGMDVTLVEPTHRIGGLTTSGLSYSDFRSFEALTGFFREFADRVRRHYVETYGPDSRQVKDCWRGTLGEPEVNRRVFAAMLEEQGVKVARGRSLARLEFSDWRRGRRRIQAAVLRSSKGKELRVEAGAFIDASYEGDLMAMAGENFHVGRESRSQYGEPMAGDKQGRGDGQVQGYNFRFIMTQVESNKLMAPRPEGYRREDFAGVLRHFESGRLKKVFSPQRDGIFRAHLPMMPNGKTDVNDTPHAPVRLSMPDVNDGYPNGGPEERARIVARHRYYNVGLIHFLQNDPAVPAPMRADARSWGFCRDEFPETGGISPRLYIREARRMIGQRVFTGRDTLQAPGDARGTLHADSIAIGDYVHNCHGTGRTGSRFDGKHDGEFYKPVPPYQIRYGVIVPQKTSNLLVPVACSASHFGFGALRLEPIWTSLGQAAGWAAALSVSRSVDVQDINVPDLQRKLHSDGSATIYVSDAPPESPDFAAVQWFGTKGGLHGLNPDKQPRAAHIAGQYCEAHPGHAVELDKALAAPARERWQKLLPLKNAATAKTRGDWIRSAFAQYAREANP